MPCVVSPLPIPAQLETIPILRKVASAQRYLAELKGISQSIPNQGLLISTLCLQEAKASSEIENIITTHDELYKAELDANLITSSAAKEVQNYGRALSCGFEYVREFGFLTCNHILEIQAILAGNRAGFRKLPGTALKNDRTGETMYTPPQSYDDIVRLMSNLENYINNDSLEDINPLIKMTLIHHQFESIHPFYDGNGRTGRIINILYLVLKDLLDVPILYLSRYIHETKFNYYRLLQSTREQNLWEEWILYILQGVEITSRQTILIIQGIKQLMHEYKRNIRTNFPKFYSQDLLNNLFRHPYTKIEFVERDLGVSRITATKYLDQLAVAGYLEKHKIWRTNYYINRPFFTLLANPPNPR